MVESHTKRRDHEYILGEHLLGKIFKMMLKKGSDSKSAVAYWFVLSPRNQRVDGSIPAQCVYP